MVNMLTIDTKIKTYLMQQFLFEFDGDNVTPETNLFSSGHIDSFGFVELIAFLEAEFKLKFTDEELLSNNLNSLAGLVAAVEGKLAYAN